MSHSSITQHTERGPLTLSKLIEDSKKRHDERFIANSGLGDLPLDVALGSVAGLMGLEEFAHTPEFKALDKLIETKRLQSDLLKKSEKLKQALAAVQAAERELASAS